MKRAVECLSCGETVARRSCYSVRKLEFTKELMTGKIIPQEVDGFVCAICNKRMGYKTNKAKLEKLLKARGEVKNEE